MNTKFFRLCYNYRMEKIEWQAPEYIHTEKNSDWYWIVGIVSRQHRFDFNHFERHYFRSADFGFGFHPLPFRQPSAANGFARARQHSASSKGHFSHKYEEIKSFWVETTDAYPRILFKIDHRFSPYFIFLIHPDDAEEIRDFFVRSI